MAKNITMLAISGLFAASVCATENPPSSSLASPELTPQGDLRTGAGMSIDMLKPHAEYTARQLIKSLGQQQTFAMLGWQVEPDYVPMQHCFDHWHFAKAANKNDIENCEQHVKDLSRLYASYGVDAPPVLFKSEFYWDQKNQFDLAWPKLVDKWKTEGGSEEDISYLKHPVCAEPLQKGWTGSDFFYDGNEHPICRAHKLEQIENSPKNTK